MKRVLIITYYWPPSGGSGVQRWLKFAKYLPQYGWEGVVYTPSNPQANSIDNALLKDVRPDTTIIKRRIIEPYGLYKVLSGKKKDKPIKANIVSSKAKKSLLQRISLFVRGNLFIPDPRILWVGPSVRFLKRYLKKHPVDAIVSTGPPHSMHLIAKRVSKATGTPWIADFRDPWTEIFYFKHLGLGSWAYKKHRNLEQSVLDNASQIIVVSDKMKKDFECRTNTPVEVITNGFDPDDFKPAGTAAKVQTSTAKAQTCAAEAQTGKFTLVHTGLLVDDGNPDLLWKILGEKAVADVGFRENLQIRVMGQTDNSIIEDITRNGLAPNFVNMGYVSHDTATMWQQNASLLLLPLRKEPEAAAILTGKFFEYLAAGRAILAFGPTTGDLAKALEETQSGTICDWDQEDAIREALDNAYRIYLEQQHDNNGQSSENTHAPREFSSAALKYSRRELTGKLSVLMNNIINRK